MEFYMNMTLEGTLEAGGDVVAVADVKLKVVELFKPNGTDTILRMVREEVEAHEPDVSTAKGR
jgi:hypothetical protein